MGDIQIFNNPTFGEIRTIVLDGQPWFVGRDIAKALGYARPDNAVTTHCKHSLKQGVPSLQSSDKEVEATVIPEGDMYRLISKSKLKSAEQFEEWVFDEVLPTIRKTGSYGTPQTLQQQIQTIAQGTDELYQRVDALGKKLQDELMNLPLLGVESDTVDKALKNRGVEIAGGKESNAYKDKNLLRRIYWDLHGQLRREFGVSTYKAIKRNQTDLALKFLAEYKPPMHLREQIENVNAQQSIDLEGGVR